MTTLTVATVILLATGLFVFLLVAFERHHQEQHGVSWLESVARRAPGSLLPEGDRDLARTLDDVRAASQRDAS